MKSKAEARRRGASEKIKNKSSSSPRLRISASPRSMRRSIRILTAVPICDGHDSAISTINMELIRGGVEVIYLGFHRSVRDIVRAAVQEDVAAIGLSSYHGGLIQLFVELGAQLRPADAHQIGLCG